MSKTVMQELIYELSQVQSHSNKISATINLIIDMAEEKLPKEKQQIIDAFTDANTIDQQGTIDAEQYYNLKFKDNEQNK